MKRIFSAVVLIPLTYLIVHYSDPFLFFLALTAIIALVQWEFYRLAREKGLSYPFLFYLISSLLIPVSFYLSLPLPNVFGLLTALLILTLYQLLQRRTPKDSLTNLSLGCFGFVYGSLFLSFLITIKNFPQGEKLLFAAMIVAWSGDTAAYYTGRHFGKHKLAPQISPNKTAEGAVGGLGGSLIGLLLFKQFFFKQLPWLDMIFLSLFFGAIGQLGDLMESVIKRSAEVKDSGHLIPGHGGILDRLDSLIFIAPFYYYYLNNILAIP